MAIVGKQRYYRAMSHAMDCELFFFSIPQLHQGDIHISGCYQPVAGKMVFNILEARNLPRVSLLGAVSKYPDIQTPLLIRCSLVVSHCAHIY